MEIRTEWINLVMFYIMILLIAVALQVYDLRLTKIFLGADFVFLGFVLWLERPFIPVLRKSPYLGILTSIIMIFLGLLVSTYL